MKKMFFVFITIIFVGINVYPQANPSRDSQWNFFSNVIPRNRSITIHGNTPTGNDYSSNYGPLNWSMTIDDKYNVSFSGDFRADSITIDASGIERMANPIINGDLIIYVQYLADKGVTVTYRGTGSLIWDNGQIKAMIRTNASGRSLGTQITSENRRNRGHIGTARRDTVSSGNSTINLVFDLQADYNESSGQLRLLLSQNRLNINMTGDYPATVSSTIGGSTWYPATVSPKTQSELNASANDEFGEWSWNTDRTRLFLKSRNSDNKFIILNNGGTVTWSMEMAKGTRGSSESTTDTGEKLVNLAMSFDGAPAQNISFIENTEASNSNFIQLDYVVYNRFLGTLDKNSDTVLNQIKEKQILILTYTVNNVQRTDMFLLHGLTTILEYLKGQ